MVCLRQKQLLLLLAIEMSTEYIHDGYNINVVMNAFKNVVRSDGVTIDLDGFVFAYRELVK